MMVVDVIRAAWKGSAGNMVTRSTRISDPVFVVESDRFAWRAEEGSTTLQSAHIQSSNPSS